MNHLNFPLGVESWNAMQALLKCVGRELAVSFVAVQFMASIGFMYFLATWLPSIAETTILKLKVGNTWKMAPCWNGHHFLEHIIFRFSVLLRGCSFFWMFFLSNRADKWQSLHELAIFVRELPPPPKAHPYHIHILKVEEQNFWQGASEWIWCWCRFWHVHRG